MNEVSEANVKECCAAFYGSDLARLLLGESFHPGGTSLTDRLARLTRLTAHSRVLDAAAGRGTTAFYIAESFGCEVAGIDLSGENVKLSREGARTRPVGERVSFHVADAEELPFEDQSFDAILCECAFCTFPDKQRAASEFFRVLRPGGRLGFSDLTRVPDPLPELEGLLSWVACIGAAQPAESYAGIFRSAGFVVEQFEDHSEALTDLVQQVQGRLLGIEIATALKKLDLPNVDFSEARRLVRAASQAVADRKLGYTLMVAVNRASSTT